MEVGEDEKKIEDVITSIILTLAECPNRTLRNSLSGKKKLRGSSSSYSVCLFRNDGIVNNNTAN